MNKKTFSNLKNSIFAISWQFRIAPFYTLFIFVWRLLEDVITLLEHTFMLAYIISCVENSRPFYEILYFVVPVAIAATVKVTVGPFIDNYYYPKVQAKLRKTIHLKLYKKASCMEISKYDNTEFYNDYVWAMQKAPNHITGTTDTLIQLVVRIVTIVISGAYIVTADPVALFAVAFLLLSTFALGKLINKAKLKREEETMPISRKREYTNRVFYLSDYVKDLKMSNMAEKLKQDYRESSDRLEKLNEKHGKRMGALGLLRKSANDIVYDGAYLTYLFYTALVKGKYGLGQLLALYKSASLMSSTLYGLLNTLPAFEWHSMHINKLRTFLETDNEMPDGVCEAPENGDIILDGLHFSYPGSEAPVLNGISMTIKKGEKIALVGYNGAGKSTLIKLILRLYDPDRGCVRYDEKNVKEYKLSDYRKRFGVLFQDFEMIASTLGNNINMSNGILDVQRADAALKDAAFWERFQTLADGYDTPLTKEFDESGVNLSGGEKQKIALARVIYSDSNIIILDEPSSALDPIAEYRLNKTVTELAGDKTVIIISHRLSTTRFVDRIYMLENGKIIEQGDHTSLMAIKGKYAEMFTLQAEKYR